jgi:hypothetical protein
MDPLGNVIDEPTPDAGAPPASTVVETEHAAQADLLAVLRLVGAGKLAVSQKTRRPGAAAVRLVAGVLDGGDFYADDPDVGPIKAFAWPLLVQAAGLAVPSGPRLALTKAGTRALNQEPAETLSRTWRRWLSTTLIDELSRIDEIKGQAGRGRRGLTAVGGRRAAISVALGGCPVGRWVAIDDLFAAISRGFDFEVTRDPWRLYVGGDPEYGSLGYAGSGGWHILQARYALAVLLEYTATLGIIDVACVPPAGARYDYRDQWGTDSFDFLSRYDGLAHIRVNRLGAFCLGTAKAYEPTARAVRPVFCVLADFEITSLGDDLTNADRLTLDRYAERTADRVWRLTRDRLLTCAESGDSIDRVREFLTTRSTTGIPAAVTQLLDDAALRCGALTDRGPALLIECADPALAALLSNDRRTRGLCLLAGDRMLAVPSASEAAFRRAAREAGYVVGR